MALRFRASERGDVADVMGENQLILNSSQVKMLSL